VGKIPIVPMNSTFIPVCSNRFPSFGRIVTVPLTVSPSRYSGAFSLRPDLSTLISTVGRSSVSSRTMSISTGTLPNKGESIPDMVMFGQSGNVGGDLADGERREFEKDQLMLSIFRQYRFRIDQSIRCWKKVLLCEIVSISCYIVLHTGKRCHHS